jgi:hypothetical protein
MAFSLKKDDMLPPLSTLAVVKMPLFWQEI